MFIFLFAIITVLVLSITHAIGYPFVSHKKKFIKYCFQCFCFPIFCIKTIKYQEARLWLSLMGFIPPLWSAFSHLGYVICGWISYEDRSIAVLILYLISFVFLYSSLQSAYRSIYDIREYIRSNHDHGSDISYEHEMREYTKLYNETGFNYVVLVLMFLPWLLFNGIIIIMGCIVVYLPVLESIDDILTHIYSLGHYTFIFAVFLLTYNLVYLTGERGEGGGLGNMDVLRFWKYLSRIRYQTYTCTQTKTESTN